MIKIIEIKNSYFQENTYIINYVNKTYVIDPGNNIELIKKNIKKIDYILLTHGHMDHCYSSKELSNMYNAKIYLNNYDLPFINKEVILDNYFPNENYCFNTIDYSKFKEKNIEIINTPGHSKGSVSIYFKEEKILFTGDTIFKGSFGRFDFPFGSLNELKNSITNLFKLDDDVIIYPGHGEKTSIYDEKRDNLIKFY